MSFIACALTILLTPAAETKTLEAAGFTWTYSLAKPAGKAKGLILAMHGAGGNGNQFNRDAQWEANATKAGFAIVFPTGLPAIPRLEANPQRNPNLWNSGELQGRSPRAKIDDFVFFEKLVKTCSDEVGKVPLFLTGHSNGSGMSFLLASKWSDRVTAIGVMSGAMKADLTTKAKKPVPTIYFAGDADPLVPWAGGKAPLPWGDLERDCEPVLQMMSQWAKWQGLPERPKATKLSDTVTVHEYIGETEKNLIRVVQLVGHGHGWSGGRSRDFPQRMGGPNIANVDATAEILKFFTSQLSQEDAAR